MGNAKRRLEEQRAQRDRLVRIVIVVLLLAGAGIAYVLLDPLGSSPEEGDGSFSAGASALIYADFDEVKDLHRVELDSRQDLIETQLPKSGNTVASFGSSWLAIQVPEKEADNMRPVQYLFDPVADRTVNAGVLLEPAFSPDGESLAGLRPLDETRCGASRCSGDKVVVVLDPGDPQSEEELSDPGRLILRGWAGDHLLVSNGSDDGLPVAQSISPEGEVTELPFLPKSLWGGSPDGSYLIESGAAGTRFHDFSDGRVGDVVADIGIPRGSVLGAGAWSPDSTRSRRSPWMTTTSCSSSLSACRTPNHERSPRAVRVRAAPSCGRRTTMRSRSPGSTEPSSKPSTALSMDPRTPARCCSRGRAASRSCASSRRRGVSSSTPR